MHQSPRPPEPESDAEPEINLPGLGPLREAVAYARRQLPRRAGLGQDGLAGLNSAIGSVPDGLASGVLAGVNPIYGLYACMAGPIVGGIVSSTQLMVITTTTVSALAAGEVLIARPPEERDNVLFVMVLCIGAFQVLFGLLRLGRLTRFVSYSVMTGFIDGIAVLTVLSQLPTGMGYEPSGGNRISQTLDLLANLGQISLPSLGLMMLALVLAVLLPRTVLGNFGNLLAIAIPSVLVALFGLDSVQLVRDVGTIPSAVPVPSLPSISGISFDVVTGALALAAIILVQGAGVSQSVPNPDSSRRSMSRDFLAQGAANIASGLFRGLPVGASVGTTALSVLSGARSRGAAIFSGLWMTAIVALFPGAVSYVAMPTLAALLIVASLRTIKPFQAVSLWKTGWPSRLASIPTFVATLFLPIQAAVGLGVVLSILIYVSESSADVVVVELVERADGQIEERRPDKTLASNTVTVLDVYGHLFFGGARTLERLLPSPQGAQNPVVVLRLLGRTSIGATLVEVLANYADQLQSAHGRLYLSGLSQEAHDQVVRTGKLHLNGPVRAYQATPIVGQSTRQALADARVWLVSLNEQASSGEASSGDASRSMDEPDGRNA